MKAFFILTVAAVLLGCNKQAKPTPVVNVTVQTASIIHPPAGAQLRADKKREDMTVIVYPPGTSSTEPKRPLPPIQSGKRLADGQ